MKEVFQNHKIQTNGIGYRIVKVTPCRFLWLTWDVEIVVTGIFEGIADWNISYTPDLKIAQEKLEELNKLHAWKDIEEEE